MLKADFLTIFMVTFSNATWPLSEGGKLYLKGEKLGVHFDVACEQLWSWELGLIKGLAFLEGLHMPTTFHDFKLRSSQAEKKQLIAALVKL